MASELPEIQFGSLNFSAPSSEKISNHITKALFILQNQHMAMQGITNAVVNWKP
jgi:hypothetical protein